MFSVLTIQAYKVVGDVSGFDTMDEAAEYIKRQPKLTGTSYAISF
jgi:hypothetical protein